MARGKGHVPERTCLGCRRQCPARELVRLCAVQDVLVLCPPALPLGRGAWIHPDATCLAAARKGGAFARTLRRAVTVPGELVSFVEAAGRKAH